MSTLKEDPFVDTIPVKEGINLTTNWRNFISELATPNYIRAFYIPIVDIVELATYHQAEAVRAYLSLTVPNDPSTAKVVIVPINALTGEDIISVVVTDPTGVERIQSTVYDMTQPCPQACDFTSVLYEG